MSPFAEVSRLLGVGLNGVALTPARLGWQPRVREVIGGRSGRGARGPQPRDGTAVAAIGAAGHPMKHWFYVKLPDGFGGPRRQGQAVERRCDRRKGRATKEGNRSGRSPMLPDTLEINV